MALAFCSAAPPPTVKWGGAVSCMQCAMAMASPHPYQLLLTASDFFLTVTTLYRAAHMQRLFGSFAMHD
jgi:hypothetical protein